MATSLATIQGWLDEALAAKHALVTGQQVVKVTGPAGAVEFTAADHSRLDGWISTLQSWIAGGAVSTSSGPRPIYFGF